MISEIEKLEVELNLLNNKIIYYDKWIRKVKFAIIQKFIVKRMNKVIETRNECFRELRELVKKKFPEKIMHNPLEEDNQTAGVVTD